MLFNLPNTLTWARILMIPIFIGVFFLPDAWLSLPERNLIATAIFILAGLTDWLDGYLARVLDQTSKFGAFLDPVADKLMVAGALLLLVELDRVNTIVGFIIIGREIAVSALREWMAQNGATTSVAVSLLGKIKTVSQMVAIPLLLYQQPLLGINTGEIGSWLIYLAALLTLWSMAYYLKAAWPVLSRR